MRQQPSRKHWAPLAALALALVVGGCAAAPPAATPSQPVAESPQTDDPLLILVSLDGFRADFLDRGVTPTLSRLAAEGVRAERLVPSFPSKTFPNHYTIVTGLRPAEHGLVANNIYDPVRDLEFGLSNREAVGDGAWYGGEPIWVTAELAGLDTAPMFWPGSEAEIRGVRPTHSLAFDQSMTPSARVDWLLERLSAEGLGLPRFSTLYFDTVDTAAHQFGPDPSPELAQALARVDGAVSRLVDGLDERQLTANLLIVSDHGMAATSSDRVIFVDDYVDTDKANVIDWNPILGLWPEAEAVETIYQALAGAHPHLAVYRRDEIPERFGFRSHERIPPIVGIADEGWSVTSRGYFDRCPTCFNGGTHGYDQWSDSMAALLIAHGPSFRTATTIGAIENFHLYNAMCTILGLEPAPNSGDPARAAELLVESSSN